MFESVARQLGKIQSIVALQSGWIEDSFGTDLRYWSSRPRTGSEVDHFAHRGQARNAGLAKGAGMTSYAVSAQAVSGIRPASTRAQQGPSGVAGGRLALTVRGRRLRGALIAMGTAGLLVAAVTGAPVLPTPPAVAAVTGSAPFAAVPFATVTVQPGESLWLVAERVVPGSDPREVIAELALLNNLSGATVQAGQTLAIPAKYIR